MKSRTKPPRRVDKPRSINALLEELATRQSTPIDFRHHVRHQAQKPERYPWGRKTTDKYFGVWPNDVLWMVALRRADRHGRDSDPGLLIKLLRSKTDKMPDGLEMSPMALELLANLLERWRPGKRDKRFYRLFSSQEPLSEDEYRAAADNVLEKQYGQFPAFRGSPLMSQEEAIKQEELESRGNTKANITVDKLREFIDGKINFGKRKKASRKRKK